MGTGVEVGRGVREAACIVDVGSGLGDGWSVFVAAEEPEGFFSPASDAAAGSAAMIPAEGVFVGSTTQASGLEAAVYCAVGVADASRIGVGSGFGCSGAQTTTARSTW